MSGKDKPEVDANQLDQLATEDPKSKKWNNPNSRKNLKQYKGPTKETPTEQSIVPEVIIEGEDEQEADAQAEEITRGRRLSPEFVKRLIPKRGILTPTEKKRYNGIVTTFLSDFKNEEPTASDVDDILEIAMCDVMEMRLMDAARTDSGSDNSAAVLVSISQTLERLHKRKQAAKSNLANRRTDRKDARASQDLNIVDLVVRFDNEQRRKEQSRVEELLNEEENTRKKLSDVLDKDGY